MQFTQDNLDELNILVRYKLTTTLEGIKVHTTAAPATIEATRRLYDKGLITLEDGGYLTALGHETAEHAHGILGLLNPS
ncbi:TIGR02647 family protein [Methyloglobulus sp.]|uniref:TIGR02647 family protein n=1 Tax=Methyloglobulus sp. TaxID=2518622 RepID=UPI0032B8771A